MNQDIEQQARKEAEALLALVKKYRPITDECPRCDGMGCSGPCPPHYWEAPMLEGFATFISERSKPSLMVGFSEEEIERIALGRLPVELFQLNEDGKLDMPSVPPIDINSDLRAQFIDGLRYANANTRAVSIDKIMEVVMGWCCATKDAEEDLRERLMKMAALP